MLALAEYHLIIISETIMVPIQVPVGHHFKTL